MRKKIGEKVEDKRKHNKGRLKVLSARERRNIVREVPILRKEKGGNFYLKDIRTGAGISKDISDSTVSRVLYKKGYGYRRSRRKGILTEKDVKGRLKFARYAKRTFNEDIYDGKIFHFTLMVQASRIN